MSSFSVYRKIECLVTNSGFLKTNGVRPKEIDLGLIRKGAVVFSKSRGTLWVGSDKELPKEFRKSKTQFNCQGLVAYPGFTDAHSHPVFSGHRAGEFSRRLAGATYQEISQAGGGIQSSVNATRAKSKQDLVDLVTARFKRAHAFGIRLQEAKSGYGLSFKDEIKSLETIHLAAKRIKGFQVLATCLAAHSVPKEWAHDRDGWINEICGRILPAVKKKSLADFVDVFCDKGFFSNEEAEKIFLAAKALGFKIRMHGDELADTGGAELAARLGALSVDHLLCVSTKSIAALAKSSTVGILLPGTSLFLREPPAPARKLIDSGVAVALATDFNPGTCPTQNLPLIASLGALQLGMTTAEIVASITWNAARSLGKANSFGALLAGFQAEPVFSNGDDPAAIYYELAPAQLPLPPRL